MSASTTRLKKYLAISTLSLALAFSLPCVSYASFGWTPAPASVPAPPPSAAPKKSAPPATMAGPLTPEPDSPNTLPVPVGTVESGSLSPEPAPTPEPAPEAGMKTLTHKKTMEAAPPVGPSVSSATTAPQPLEQDSPADVPLPRPEPKEKIEPVRSSPLTTSPSKETAPLEGFGKDLPLVLALRQIVPTEYAYGFASNDLAGIRVDWQGGKSWPLVLSDTLSAAGLRADVTGKAILISKMAGYAPLSAASPASSGPVSSSPLPVPVSPRATLNKKDPLPLTEETPKAAASPTPAAPAAHAQATRESPAPEGVKSMTSESVWTARPGTTLRTVLAGWSRAAKVELDWVTPYDYPIANAFTFTGTFEQAVSSLLGTYSRETPRPRGRLYPNLPEGPSVLMVN